MVVLLTLSYLCLICSVILLIGLLTSNIRNSFEDNQTNIEGQKEIAAPSPEDWFPTSFQKSEDGKFSGNKDELLHYKNVIQEHDPFVAHQASLLERSQIAEFYYQLKQQDQEMLDRLEKLHSEGRTHLHDPEVFDWFVRRGMDKQQDLALGQAIEAGQHLLGDVWKGLVGSKDGKGLVQEFWEGAVHGKQEAQELDDIIGATWRSLGSDYQFISENTGGYFLDLIEKPGDEASPEAQELYRKAKNERQREFQLRALSNQAVYAAGAHDLANKWWQNPQQACCLLRAAGFLYCMLLASSFSFVISWTRKKWMKRKGQKGSVCEGKGVKAQSE